MPSDHAFGIRSQKLGSNKATKSKDKAGLPVIHGKFEAERLGLSTNQTGRYRKLHEQGSLVCSDSWGRKQLDTTERLN